MPRSDVRYDLPSDAPPFTVREDHIESGFIGRLQGLKYDYRPDITDRAALERNFRAKFEELNSAFNAEERFLPVYEFADEANKKIRHLDDFADHFLPKCALAKTISHTSPSRNS